MPIAFERQDPFFSKATKLPAYSLERQTQEIRNLRARQRKLERYLRPLGGNGIDVATDHQQKARDPLAGSLATERHHPVACLVELTQGLDEQTPFEAGLFRH